MTFSLKLQTLRDSAPEMGHRLFLTITSCTLCTSSIIYSQHTNLGSPNSWHKDGLTSVLPCNQVVPELLWQSSLKALQHWRSLCFVIKPETHHFISHLWLPQKGLINPYIIFCWAVAIFYLNQTFNVQYWLCFINVNALFKVVFILYPDSFLTCWLISFGSPKIQEVRSLKVFNPNSQLTSLDVTLHYYFFFVRLISSQH